MDLCSNCDRKRPVLGDGPRPCRVMLLGEQPGQEENAKLRPFVGKAGRELNGHYLPLAGLGRDEVYVTNVRKCYSPRTPTPAEALACSRHWLPKELAAVKPEIVVALGGTAYDLVKPVDGTKLDLEAHHGIPLLGGIYGWRGVVLPGYHPAAGLHKSRTMTQIRGDFQALGRLLSNGGKPTPIKAPGFSIAEERGIYAADHIRKALHKAKWAAIDTESDGDDPYCLTTSVDGERSYFMPASQQHALSVFGGAAFVPVLHNYPYDHFPLEKMGIHLDPYHVIDTMQMAFHRDGLPLGLKPLAFRLCGMRLESYENVVGPPSLERIHEYLSGLLTRQLPTPDQSVFRNKSGGWQMSRKHGVREKVERLLKLDDPWKIHKEWAGLPGAAEVERLVGIPLPRPSIALVERRKAVKYACGDSIATYRVREVMECSTAA